MGIFQKKIGPVFLKEDGDLETFIQKMEGLREKADGKLKQDIEKEINLANYGLLGEKNIIFELKNSDLDMYILHDLYFECGENSAQIDYLIFTRKRVYIIECKNLIGNIEIDSGGNFVRTYELFGKKIKEGLYSPITQNERHRLVIKEIRSQRMNKIERMMFEKSFYSNYKSVIVLANPKTYLNAKFAKKEVKNQVVRADQLIAYIKEMDKENKDFTLKADEMFKLATFFLNKSMTNKSDYSSKYEAILESVNSKNLDKENEVSKKEDKKICPRCGAELVLRLAKKGEYEGKKFYGCSSFPKCRYVENIEQ